MALIEQPLTPRVMNPSIRRCEACCSDVELEMRVRQGTALMLHAMPHEEPEFDPCAAMAEVAAITKQTLVTRAFIAALDRLRGLASAVRVAISKLQRLTRDVVRPRSLTNRLRPRSHGPPPPTLLFRFDLQRQGPPTPSDLALEGMGLVA